MKTILYGAFGRHNFGDMLFPHIIEKLIKENSSETDLEFCDILSRDMREYGGHNVKSISDFFDYEKPLNIIHVGGEVGGCGLKNAIRMFEPEDIHDSQLSKLQHSNLELAYIINKNKFKNPNIFVANAIGGMTKLASKHLQNFNYISFRDKRSYLDYGHENAEHMPDSVVMLNHYFNKEVTSRLELSQSLQSLNKSTGNDYIAVQFKPQQLGDCVGELRRQFNKIIDELNMPIVFFCAGVATGHDSIAEYKKLFGNSLPSEMVHYYDGEYIWDICNLISRATCVIGTSLHVRVVASQYAVPRVAINLQEMNDKRASQYVKTCHFINDWDSVKNSKMKMINLFENVKKSIDQNNPEAQHKHNKKLQDIVLKKTTWTNYIT